MYKSSNLVHLDCIQVGSKHIACPSDVDCLPLSWYTCLGQTLTSNSSELNLELFHELPVMDYIMDSVHMCMCVCVHLCNNEHNVMQLTYHLSSV